MCRISPKTYTNQQNHRKWIKPHSGQITGWASTMCNRSNIPRIQAGDKLIVGDLYTKVAYLALAFTALPSPLNVEIEIRWNTFYDTGKFIPLNLRRSRRSNRRGWPARNNWCCWPDKKQTIIDLNCCVPITSSDARRNTPKDCGF